ncbi:4Fe-4S binding protein [Desulfallas sp. Bu1-1]|uniref:4Fe-4S binding protein n=1 Tax=Desulfallas sp. Bu1-1 TaxID=2787620 RepID=UPI00189EF6C9|nr:4Fe-4S binding protein [Desulfallas sp. Bu1-1]MBF7083947.1 4Fe-4S binding protein [Desulfallas sp. Bu1-1]
MDGRNLLGMTPVKSFIKSRLFPGIFQWPTAFVFAVVIYQLFYGPSSAHDNFGTAMTWVLWWPIIPLVFLLLGRFWCAICPFATLSDIVQKWVGNHRPVPVFLKKYGIWIIDAMFILITWADHIFGIVESPLGSGVLLLIIITGVVISGAFFERRTWCRYLCFLGGLSGNYSRAGVLELRADSEKCKKCKDKFCYKGKGDIAGCPMFEMPGVMDSSAKCNLCGNCVKTCPNDSVTLKARIPSKELWFISKPKIEESFLAIIIMGIVFVQNITMLEIWKDAQRFIEGITGTSNYSVTFTITFLIAMAVPVLALYLTSWLAGVNNKKTAIFNFTKFGYALIPLDLAGHLAHNLFHLLAEGKSVLYTGIVMFIPGYEGGSAALVSDGTIQILQFALIGLGLIASIFTAYKISKNNFGKNNKNFASLAPYAVLLVILAVFNIYLFTLPMSMRM